MACGQGVLATALLVGCAGTPGGEAAAPVRETGVAAEPAPETPKRRTARDRVREKLLNIELVTQDHETVRFYDDLVKDKVVLIYFMFTSCQGICPATTTNVAKMQDLFGDRFGKEVFFISVTLTPEIDTPDVLKEYAELYGAKPGWTFVTGDYDEIEMLRRKLGIYNPDPVIDADLYSHAGLVTFGNERTARWAALPGTMDAEQLVRTMNRITRERKARNQVAK